MQLYFVNLHYEVTEEKLKEIFTEHGEISKLVLIKKTEQEHHSGYGFVEFTSKENAQKALENLHGRIFEGRTLHVNDQAGFGEFFFFL